MSVEREVFGEQQQPSMWSDQLQSEGKIEQVVLRAALFLCMMTDYHGEGSARARNRSTKGVPPSRFRFEEQGKTPVVVAGDGGSGRSSVSSRSTYATRRAVLFAEKRAADAELELAMLEEEELRSRGSKSLSGGGAERSSSPKMIRDDSRSSPGSGRHADRR